MTKRNLLVVCLFYIRMALSRTNRLYAKYLPQFL